MWWFCEKRLRGRQKYGALADTSDPTIFAGCLKIFEKDGYLFFFYSNDHEPIHVHVRKGNGEAVFLVQDEIVLRESEGL